MRVREEGLKGDYSGEMEKVCWMVGTWRMKRGG